MTDKNLEAVEETRQEKKEVAGKIYSTAFEAAYDTYDKATSLSLEAIKIAKRSRDETVDAAWAAYLQAIDAPEKVEKNDK